MNREASILLLVVLALVLIGVQTVYSASALGAHTAALLKRHLIHVGVGLVVMFVTAHFDYHRLRDPGILRGLVFLALALLVLVLIPGIGVRVGGGLRWVRIGDVQFQPSEFAKLALILLLAAKLSDNQHNIKTFKRGFLPPLIITAVFAGLILPEKDLGTPVVMIAVALLMILMAGARWYYVGASVAPIGLGVLALCATNPNRLGRLTAFLNPWSDPTDKGFQLIQSLVAFTQGSIWGRGPGAGEQKLSYLPAAHTDFIFPVWAEEMGLIGSLVLVALFVAMLVVSMRIAFCACDLFGALLAGGIASLIAIQATFNMAVATGLVPTKGLPLPFISAGGSASIVFLTLVGILLNIGLQAQEPERARKYAPAHTTRAGPRFLSTAQHK